MQEGHLAKYWTQGSHQAKGELVKVIHPRDATWDAQRAQTTHGGADLVHSAAITCHDMLATSNQPFQTHQTQPGVFSSLTRAL